MKNICILLSSALCLTLTNCVTQKHVAIDLSHVVGHIEEIKVYDLPSVRGEHYTAAELAKATSITLDVKKVEELLPTRYTYLGTRYGKEAVLLSQSSITKIKSI